MSHKFAFEAVDRTLKDLRGNTRPMGGVTFLMAGDFRQILPVIQRGTKTDELKACIKASHLWRHVKRFRFSTNMRVHLHQDQIAGNFASTLLQIGNGQIPYCAIDEQINIPIGHIVQSLEDLKSKVFPKLDAALSRSTMVL